ncbi:PaaI family thioesterase [Veillonella sp. AM51-8BH]|uniref:PaaI family thioesterase n=1 Tax=Veillonella sp. AM51-8BH TaxID=2292378 RepID=UPI000E5CF9F8|nr:PaaI family thioesterase [Veillonella sp. AM51-8BH]RGZ27666.1 PaaI family thioesterase [Veillonella sp. AM51-8BH]
MNLIEALQIEKPYMTSDTTCVAKMNLGDFHKQPQGYLNGGATLAFAEIAAGMMSNELIGADKFGVGQSITANHLRPVRCEGSLTAHGTLLVKGKTSHVWRFDMKDDAERLISQVTVTLSIVDFDR